MMVMSQGLFGMCVRIMLVGLAATAGGEAVWPALPENDGEVLIPAQEWPRQPGPRSVKVYVLLPFETL